MLRVTFVGAVLDFLDHDLPDDRRFLVYEWLFAVAMAGALPVGFAIPGYEPPAHVVELPTADVALRLVLFPGRLHVVGIRDLEADGTNAQGL